MTEDLRVRISPLPVEIDKKKGFNKTNDLFSYEEFGIKLAKIFSNVRGLDVALLDGDWGMGKTVFAKQWARMMESRGHRVIEIDAFQNDFHQDPFLMLASEINVNFRGSNKDFLKYSKKIGATLLGAAVRMASGGAISFSHQDIENFLDNEINPTEEDRKIFLRFKECLGELVKIPSGDEKNIPRKPLVIIIDELDRCRPDFALRLLERIKHLFSVEEISFLLVANMKQLSAMVGSAYGLNPDEARIYLDKFYTIRVSLPRKTEKSYDLVRELYIEHLSRTMNLVKINPIRYEEGFSFDEGKFTSVANTKKLSLRDIERVAVHVALIKAAGISGNRYLIEPFVTGLLVIRLKDPDLYREILNTDQDAIDRRRAELWGKINSFFLLPDTISSRVNTLRVEHWMAAACPSVTLAKDDRGSLRSEVYFRLHLSRGRNRLDFLPSAARQIEGLLGIEDLNSSN